MQLSQSNAQMTLKSEIPQIHIYVYIYKYIDMLQKHIEERLVVDTFKHSSDTNI